MESSDSEELERLIKGHCRGELDSVRIHIFVRRMEEKALEEGRVKAEEK